jgi:hypothetical protein
MITKAKRRATIAAADQPAEIQIAINRMCEARDILRACGAKNAADYVARALKSAEGAYRHAKGTNIRTGILDYARAVSNANRNQVPFATALTRR